MSELTEAAAALNGVAAKYAETRDQLVEIAGGPADGGPEGDGMYPITLANGEVVSMPSVAKMQAMATVADVRSITAGPGIVVGPDVTTQILNYFTTLRADDWAGALSIPDGLVFDEDAVRAAVPPRVSIRDRRKPTAILRTGTDVGEWRIDGDPNLPNPYRRMAFVELFITSMFGRGMLTAEVPYVVTEQAITATFAEMAEIITVEDVSKFEAGGLCVIEYDNGRYMPHLILAKGSETMALLPDLHFPLSAGARIERAYYDRAHPGKFFQRHMAQRIARGTELELACSDSDRLIFTMFEADAPEQNVSLYGGATDLNYYNASPTDGGGLLVGPARFPNRSAYFQYTVAGAGVETALHHVRRPCQFVAKVTALVNTPNTIGTIRLVDENDVVLASTRTLGGLSQRAQYIYTLTGHTRRATKIRLQFEAGELDGDGEPIAPGDAITAGYAVVSMIDVFEAPFGTGKVISKPDMTIVVWGDSLVEGLSGATPEREGLAEALAREMPQARIINAGHGGDDLGEGLARFDEDVAVHNPDVVISLFGTNDGYSPPSGSFEISKEIFRDRYSEAVSRILGIGARPIMIGVPALAQIDETSPGLAEWVAHERSRGYSLFMHKHRGIGPKLALDTGWTAATGTPSKGAFAASAAGAASPGYVQSELQAALNRIAAVEARLIGHEAVLRLDGKIDG